MGSKTGKPAEKSILFKVSKTIDLHEGTWLTIQQVTRNSTSLVYTCLGVCVSSCILRDVAAVKCLAWVQLVLSTSRASRESLRFCATTPTLHNMRSYGPRISGIVRPSSKHLVWVMPKIMQWSRVTVLTYLVDLEHFSSFMTPGAMESKIFSQNDTSDRY